MFNIYNDADIAYLNRSRLDQLVPQLGSPFLNFRIIQRGLNYLIPALSRTLFEFDPTSSNDPLQVAQHLRIHKHDLKYVIPEFVVSVANQDRPISLRSIYLDIGLKDLSSLLVDPVNALKDLLRVCTAMRIEAIYEAQEVGLLGEVRPSEEFRRRQRDFKKLEARIG